MFEAALKESMEQRRRMEKEWLEFRAEMQRVVNRNTFATITILGALMALFAFVEHFLH